MNGATPLPSAWQKSQELAQAMIDSLHAHVCVLEEDGTLLAVNQAWRDFAAANPPLSGNTGVGADYLAVCDAATGPDAEIAREFAVGIRAVMAGTLDQFELEYPCHSPQQERWFVGRVTRLAGDASHRVVIAHDNITERKQAEEELREKERILSESQRLGHVGSWFYDLKGPMKWSDEMYRLYGVSPATFIPTAESLLSLIHPDDRPAMQAWLTTCAAGVKHELVFRINRPDGAIRFILGRGESFHDAENRLIHMAGTAQDITERNCAEDQLRVQAAALDAAANAIVITDHTGTIQSVNPAFTALTGYSAQEAVGQNPRLLKSGKQDEAIYRTLWQTISSDRVWHGELVNRRKDGSLYTEEMTITPMRGADGQITRYIAIKQDVTARKRAEAERVRLAAILEATTDLVSFSDPVGNILYYNRAGRKLLGIGVDEDATKLSVADLIPNPSQNIILTEGVPTAIREGIWSGETFLLSRSGREIPVSQIILSHKAADGTLEFLSTIMRDITERKQAEEVVRAKTEELKRFTYAVSHDLRSPLVTIQTFLGHLEQDIPAHDAARVAKDLDFIHGAAKKMGQLLDELLKLSRVGSPTNPPADVPLQGVVKEALALVAGRISQRGVQVTVAEDPVTLHGDRSRLVAIFQNLVDNACKFMGDQLEPRIEIGVEPGDATPVFCVRDNGIGIDPRQQAKLFGLFVKLDPRAEGTGIGLTLVKRIVEQYRGRIWVESKGAGQGTGFLFTLPGAIQKAETVGQAPRWPSVPVVAGGAPALPTKKENEGEAA